MMPFVPGQCRETVIPPCCSLHPTAPTATYSMPSCGLKSMAFGYGKPVRRETAPAGVTLRSESSFENVVVTIGMTCAILFETPITRSPVFGSRVMPCSTFLPCVSKPGSTTLVTVPGGVAGAAGVDGAAVAGTGCGTEGVATPEGGADGAGTG